MKRFFEILGISAIILFSFYYTEKAALMVQSKSPIMQEINESAKEEQIQAVNAVIEGNTIIPGINGLEVNAEKSFMKMKGFGAFNDYYLVFDEVKPKLSLEDNKDKLIIKGNKNKKAVSIIIKNNSVIKTYLEQNNIQANLIVNEESYKKNNLEQLNGEYEKNKFENVESLLNKDNKNKNICLIEEKNKQICQNNNKYLVKENLILNSNNIIDVKNNIESGSIILIKETAKLEDFNLLLKQIEFKGLKIIHLSKLISESN